MTIKESWTSLVFAGDVKGWKVNVMVLTTT